MTRRPQQDSGEGQRAPRRAAGSAAKPRRGLAAQAAENMRLREALRVLAREAELGRRINRADSLDDLLDEVIDYIRDRWGFDIIGIQLTDVERRVLRGYRYSGRRVDQRTLDLAFTEVPLDPKESISAVVALRQQPVYVRTGEKPPFRLSQLDIDTGSAMGISGSLLVPIVDAGLTIGVVLLGERRDRARLSDAAVAEVVEFVLSMGAPVQRIRVRDQMERTRREQEQLANLCRRISRTIDLSALLDVLGDEIARLDAFDGFYVALPDPVEGVLSCRKIRLPGPFKGLEGVYEDLRYPLTSDETPVRVLRENRALILDATTLAEHPPTRRHAIRGWEVHEAAILPIPLGDRAVGIVFGFTRQRPLARERVIELERILPLFSEQIRNAQFYTELTGREQHINSAMAVRQRFLKAVGHLVELRDADEIYEAISREFLGWLPFDLAGIVVQEQDRLVVKKTAIRDPALQGLLSAWNDYYRDTSYQLKVHDGATAYCFVNNARVLIDDVMQVLDLPMSAKDRRALEIIKTPRTFFFVPIRRRGEPVGVLWLISVNEVVRLSEADVGLIEALCSLIGTAIENAEMYSTVDRQRQQIERALSQLQETQEQLARAKDVAEASAAAKSVFVANTSHEIRTPLTAIIGFAEQLLEKSASGTDAANAAAVIVRNGQHLLALINDILDLSKIEAGRIDFERIAYSPLELLRDLAAVVGLAAQEKDLYFRVSFGSALPERLLGDPSRVRQALLNLCNNAVKFTDRGGVEVEVDCDRERELLRIAVQDTGPGIPEQDRDRLFKPFVQADASITRRFGGTGLGLPISRQLVEGMGGELTMRSVVGEGSRFEIRLPSGPLDEAVWLDSPKLDADPAAPAAPEAHRVAGRVLLAEDGSDNQRLILMYLESAGATPTLVENGEQAVEAALQEPYDLVLMDLQMPRLSGIDAVTALRRAGYWQPIWALTANVMAGDSSRYRAAGFDGCLSKPIDRAVFFKTLRRYLPARPPEPAPVDLTPLIERFTRELPERLAVLQRCLQREDWSALADEAHQLRGSAATLGWPEVGELAGEIQNLLRHRQPGPERRRALHSAVQRALACLEA